MKMNQHHPQNHHQDLSTMQAELDKIDTGSFIEELEKRPETWNNKLPTMVSKRKEKLQKRLPLNLSIMASCSLLIMDFLHVCKVLNKPCILENQLVLFSIAYII